jgi:hypothetical protein
MRCTGESVRRRAKRDSGNGNSVLSGCGEELSVEFATRRARRDTELLTEAIAELTVDRQGFGKIVLSGERFHQEPIAALSQWGEPDELPAGTNRACELGSRDAELSRRVALESTEVKEGQLVTDIVDPRGVLSWEEVATGDKKGHDDAIRRSLESSGLSRVSTAAGSGSRQRASATSSRGAWRWRLTTRYVKRSRP